jgi:hypothetical protein
MVLAILTSIVKHAIYPCTCTLRSKIGCLFIYGTSYIAQKLQMRIIVKVAQNAIKIFDPAFLSIY